VKNKVFYMKNDIILSEGWSVASKQALHTLHKKRSNGKIEGIAVEARTWLGASALIHCEYFEDNGRLVAVN